jgi:cyclomaltodextrinase / maltogenic alpha-amylase / neopullulanase
VEDPRGYSRLKMLHAFVSTIPGIPIIYYGDEIGMPGANDPDNRRMMRFSDLKPEEQDVKTTVTKLCNMRKSSMALCYGDTRILKADKHTLIFMRQYFDHVSVIAMNRSGEAIDISLELPSYINTTNLKPAFGSAVKIDGQTIHLNLKALSFDIVSNENV